MEKITILSYRLKLLLNLILGVLLFFASGADATTLGYYLGPLLIANLGVWLIEKASTAKNEPIQIIIMIILAFITSVAMQSTLQYAFGYQDPGIITTMVVFVLIGLRVIMQRYG